uniref:Uncharacterized protein n=1 Tax=Cannabis sativa TaxID=3483 RepID=A0A803RBD6_CANSA
MLPISSFSLSIPRTDYSSLIRLHQLPPKTRSEPSRTNLEGSHHVYTTSTNLCLHNFTFHLPK